MDYSLRRATLDDIPALTEFRILMFQSVMTLPDPDGFRAADEAALARDMREGRMAAWLAEARDTAGTATPVASAGLSFYRLPPKPWNLSGECAFVSSMFTLPQHRRKGLATRLLDKALSLARSTNVRVVTLHASPDGKRLYEPRGFVGTNEMRLTLDDVLND